MLIGYPAAFSLAAVGLFFGFIGIELGLIEPNFLGNLTYQLFGIVSKRLCCSRSRSSPSWARSSSAAGWRKTCSNSIGQLFGPVRGGLSYAVIIVGAILGAITGTVAASVIAMGVISLPVMMRYGYSTRHATGVIAASGTITQLIPPSLVLVVLADQLGRSVGDMYAGAIGPSLIQVALFCVWVADREPDLAATTCRRCRPKRARLRGWALWSKCLRGIVPSLGADLPGARHDLHGPRDADRSRRHGRGRRARCSPPFNRTPDLAARSTRRWRPPCASPRWWSSS